MNALPQKRWRRPWRRSSDPADVEALFLEHRPLIERVAESACRRAGMLPEEAEDFVSQVQLKLLENDYAVLRKHRGDSLLSTYLTTVVHNQFKDFCNHKWGKFRHSAAAKRLGSEAKALERLLVIDRRDLESAIEILKTNYRVETSRQDLREVAAKLPRRSSRHFVGEEALARQASAAPEADAERLVADGEREHDAARVAEALNLALGTLSAQDLLILKMVYRDGLTVATIATALNLEQRPLYSRKEKCLAKLRAVFAAEGLTWENVRDILGWQGHEIRAFGTDDEAREDEKNGDVSV